jgi:hypothetical protein
MRSFARLLLRSAFSNDSFVPNRHIPGTVIARFYENLGHDGRTLREGTVQPSNYRVKGPGLFLTFHSSISAHASNI